jgi:hypothetical protein
MIETGVNSGYAVYAGFKKKISGPENLAGNRYNET